MKMRRACVLAALVTVIVAGCGGGATATPQERPGVFVTRILREEINGQWLLQWAELHPGHRRLITRAQYVGCSREMGTNIGRGKEIYRVLAVRNEPIHVDDVPQRTSKLVTISVRAPGAANGLTYRVHAVAVGDHWAWILGDRFLAQIKRGHCLDGKPLPART
jgi:hypothetical protein